VHVVVVVVVAVAAVVLFGTSIPVACPISLTFFASLDTRDSTVA